MQRDHVRCSSRPIVPSLHGCPCQESFICLHVTFIVLIVKIIHYAAVAVLVLGALYYLWMKPPSVNPMVDGRAAEALAMVQTHRAQGYPTILQAMTEHVRSMSERNRVARLGEWRVKQLEGDLYEIRIQLRDQGVTGQWFEREFIWHADLALKKVNAASLPADGVTPKEPDAAPNRRHLLTSRRFSREADWRSPDSIRQTDRIDAG